MPKTTAPPPELFWSIFASHQDPDEPNFCIHPSSHLSVTVRSAETVKLNFPDLIITAIDTQLVSSPQGMVVHMAATWNNKGISPAEIHQRIIDLSSPGKFYFLVATLDYLACGGRIGGASALPGNALLIKPILTLTAGRTEPHSKARTFNKALENLRSLALDEYPRDGHGRMSKMQAANLSLAQDLSSYYRDRLNIPRPQISF